MIPLQIWLYLAITVLAGLSGWRVNEWKWQAKEADRAKQELADQQSNAATAIRRLENVISAQSAAKQREHSLRVSAAAARSELDGLRTSISTTLSAAANDHAACTERASALGELLGAMAQTGGEIAAKADRHANDAAMMQQAWPR